MTTKTSDKQIDVDEEILSPIIHGYCTPVVNVDDNETRSISSGDYQKTTKPIAVDSAIANSVWDTIIEEEEEEIEEVEIKLYGVILKGVQNGYYYKHKLIITNCLIHTTTQ